MLNNIENKSYNTDIIAVPSFWRADNEMKNCEEENLLLQEKPVTGNTYLVEITECSAIALNMELWLLYESPSVFHGEYQSEKEIDRSSFCLVKTTKIILKEEDDAIVEITVIKTLSYQEILKTYPVANLPVDIANMCINNYIGKSRINFNYIKYGKYRILTNWGLGFNLQCIFAEIEEEFFICMLTIADSYQSTILGGKFNLPIQLKREFGNKIFY